jgi:N utilization substance protein B
MTKTDARERCVLLFFEAEQKQIEVSKVVQALAVAPEKYCLTIIESYEENEERIIELIEQNIKNWSSDRLPAFDRAVLRMAITELVRSDEAPAGTVISESVQLCEKYSTDDSPRFINGVLSSIAHKVRAVEMLEKAKMAAAKTDKTN